MNWSLYDMYTCPDNDSVHISLVVILIVQHDGECLYEEQSIEIFTKTIRMC